MPRRPLLAVLLTLAVAGSALAVDADPATPIEVMRAADVACERHDAEALDKLWLDCDDCEAGSHAKRVARAAQIGDWCTQVRAEHIEDDAAVVSVIDLNGDVDLVHFVKTAAGWRITPHVRNGKGLGALSERLAPAFAKLDKWLRRTWIEVKAEREAALPPEARARLAADRAEAAVIAGAVLAWVKGREGAADAIPFATQADILAMFDREPELKAHAAENGFTADGLAEKLASEKDKELQKVRAHLARFNLALDSLAIKGSSFQDKQVKSLTDRTISADLETAAGEAPIRLSIETMIIDGKPKVMPGGLATFEHPLETDDQ